MERRGNRSRHIDQAVSVTPVPDSDREFRVDIGKKVLVGEVIPVNRETGTAIVAIAGTGRFRIPHLFRCLQLQEL